MFWRALLAFLAMPAMVVYVLIVVTAFHLRVVFGEEPWLAATHGDQWLQYVQKVPRWFGRRRTDRAPTD